MTRKDLSILQRLSVGFGLLLLLIIGLLGFVFVLQGRSSAAERTLTEEIAPRAVRAQAVERALMSVGLEARGLLLEPTQSDRHGFDASVRTLRATIQALTATPMTPEDRTRVAQLEPTLEAYIGMIDRAVGAPRSALQAAGLAEVSRTEDAAITAVRRFVDLQNAKEEQARGTVAQVRGEVDNSLLGLSLFTFVGFLVMSVGITQAVRRPTRELLRIARALGEGDWQPALQWVPPVWPPRGASQPPRSEMAQLAEAFGMAAAALEHREQRLRADAVVARATGHSLGRQEVSLETLRAVALHVGAEAGVVYAHDCGKGLLEPVAVQGLDALPPVGAGEGIPGEAARQRRTILVNEIPPDTPLRIGFGYDSAPPRAIVAVPLLFRDDLLGVMVLASLRPLDREALAFLDTASVQFGIGLQNIRAHENVDRLVAELRERNRIIQAQSEELQTQNEEIQAQNEEIQAQAEELQAQNEEMLAQNEQLRDRSDQVEETTRQLRAQADLLAEADARKNEFLATLGHELRNPMAALTVSLRVFRVSDPSSDRASRALTIIERQVQYLSRLIDDLLDLTRISRGKISLQPEPLDLVDIVRDCLDDQRAAFEAKQIALEADLPSAPVWIRGDRTRLGQAINNLLHNAGKFTSPGGRVQLRLAVDQQTGDALLRVADDGMGIEPALLPHVFEPFRQGGMRGRSDAGLGLGLALVKMFVDLHGGAVQATSDGRGTGAAFLIRLPQMQHAATPDSPETAPASSRSRRILVVEDNEDAAWSLRQMLEIEGHGVELARTVAEAWELASAQAPEFVVCDIGLPQADGYELARRFRADDRLRGVPLVALTGFASPEDRSRAIAAGFDDHLAKPLDVQTLRRVLARVDAASSPI